MHVAEGIRKHGFRTWYERELIQGHAHLVLTVLCAIGLLAAFELMPGSRGLDRLTNLVAVAVCIVLGVWSMRRYLYLLMHAEEVANQAICPHCDTYGRFELAGSSPTDEQAPVAVRCKHCGHVWSLNP